MSEFEMFHRIIVSCHTADVEFIAAHHYDAEATVCVCPHLPDADNQTHLRWIETGKL